MISDMVSIPVIASGGIGTLNHFKDAFNIGKADAVLAASVFHRDIIPVKKVIKYLAENGIQVR
jgi:cyclase